MRDGLFYDGAGAGRKLSAFWVLLLLAAVIATAGVAADSTATVIGAMIVAPLMTPILGAVVAVVTGDGANLLRSLGLAGAGAVCVVAIAWLTGLLYPVDVVAETSSQVSGPIHGRVHGPLAVTTIVVFVVALSVPLSISGLRITSDARDRSAVADAADWAAEAGGSSASKRRVRASRSARRVAYRRRAPTSCASSSTPPGSATWRSCST